MTKELMTRRKTTRKLAGPGLRRYFEALLDAETEIASGPRRRVADALHREVAQARIRTPIPALRRALSALADGAVAAASPVMPSRDATTAAASPAASVPPAFNPYAFSAVAVMTRGGPDALRARLAAIPNPADLRRLAAAQHVAVSADAATPDDLREAILDGVANRIADRRAAAS